ncbi:DUF2207 domain-containing protein [uncultured Flavobacterium sp.]|uniref:DUF2207 domain-containing protein n=1 Tax=uncultured Flavobacterium sp. TaxID=165435 RepID=UPI0030ED62C7|tara:strand:+ start:51225 stop:53138 length:1914 start_codon:yes stop_codon:yes gene_type:complete
MKISLKVLQILSFFLLTNLISAQEEKIIDFHAEIIINNDRTINVTENIKVYANGDEIVRGIFRKIPQTRTDKNGKTFRYNIELESVKHNGQDSEYIEENFSYFSLKIGKKDVLIPSGIHDYEIKYTIQGQIGFYDTFDELYWNVTGSEWSLSITKASATIILPTSASAIQSSCYTGTEGSIEKNCSFKVDGNKTYFEAENLQAYEGLTIAVGFPKGVVNPPPPPTFLEKFGSIFLFAFSLIGTLLFMIKSWVKYGKDPQKPTVVPQFYPPENLSPAAMNMIINESYDKSSTTYSIVNLATKGYVKITDTSKKILGLFNSYIYELEKLKDSDEKIATEEQSILKRLFKENTKITFKGNYNPKIESAFNDHYQNLYDQYNSILQKGNNLSKIIYPILFFIITLIVTVYFYAYDIPPVIFFFIFTIIASLLLSGFIKLIMKLFKSKTTYGAVFRVVFTIINIVVILGIVLIKDEYSINSISIAIYVAISLILLIHFQHLIKSPSTEKLRMQSLIEGFKMYIVTTEANRLQFSNPPKMTPEYFEMILPYAMALGVDEIWGEKFAEMLNNSAIEYQSTWYVGTVPFNSSSMHSFSNSFTDTANSSSSKPSESSSSSGGSWSSGSSGGGSSGGGGGGGGGGGW